MILFQVAGYTHWIQHDGRQPDTRSTFLAPKFSCGGDELLIYLTSTTEIQSFAMKIIINYQGETNSLICWK